jgi:hypothetical protein
MTNLNETLFPNDINTIYQKYLPKINPLDIDKIQSNIWDIPYTISKLSYLVHSHYRYYGKFPSVVAGQILDQFPMPSNEHYVLDNFSGSGTTLVESKLRGIKSYGIDISWLSVLASNVKVNFVDTNIIKRELTSISDSFYKKVNNSFFPSSSFVDKWFSAETSRDLFLLREIILNMPKSPEKDFIVLAYIGIIRRVSKAFDGEVRPHINKAKKQRDVLGAFHKKIRNMCNDHEDYMQLISEETNSKCFHGTNTNLPDILNDGKCHLVISHPPYLNSFNYSPVYSLEFYWGEPFENDYANGKKNLHKEELTAHPANNKVTENYFMHLENCYRETYKIQRSGGYLAIIIADCTKNGELIPVLDKTIDIAKNIGYKPYEFNYRTTHYGLGKYAYKHRADYHGTGEKKDGILIFKR